MARRRRRRVREEQKKTNWALISGIAVLGAIGLIVLVIITATSTPEVAPPTPVLSEDIQAIDAYCQENAEHCVGKGEADAPVTVVEVVDYGCPHCRDFNKDKASILDEEYVATGRVQWLVMPYANSEVTIPAAAAALCAAEQGEDAFFGFHETVFDLQGTVDANTVDGFMQVARAIGLEDQAAFESCVEAGRHQDVVHLNRQAARQAGVEGTPSFFVNGRRIEGNQPLAVFEETFDQMLESSG